MFGLAGDKADGCPYSANSAATVEYQTLSGCTTSIPIETDGGSGTACSHWDEECFKGELMTGFASGDLELSRITVAGLQDLGYTVDFDNANAFPSSQLDPSCVCNAVKEEINKIGGFKFGGVQNFGTVKKVDSSERPKLSKAGNRAAQRYGRQYLKKKKAIRIQKGKSGVGGYTYLGDRHITVFYKEGDHLYSVHVSLPDNVFMRIPL
jgi:hypothetical protein